ncbi:WxL protein peptidoglycan domain-containing protein [Marmoricola sp. RAF53]|uniref:WxL protein peptidoglycan domain-containing protein n=1 Tax=Marmoricola sp. RAF53 TaxID=3233059 RepID=UPI003F9B2A2F
MLKRSLAALTALVLAGLTLGSLAAPAHADGSADSVSWTVRTALSKYGSGRPKFTYTIKPGEQVTDGIDIANEGRRKITLKVYAADGFTTGSGGYDVLTPDKASKGVGAWVKPAVTHVTIAPGKQVQIPFTMTVPSNATPGDHLGGIVTVLDQRDASGTGTVVHRRVGLRIESHVSGEVRSRLEVDDLKVDYDGHNPFGTGDATVRYTVRNTGNTALGGLQKVKVAGGLGLSAQTVTLARLPNLLPGESWQAKASVDDVRAMLWVSATVTVTPLVTDAAGSTSTLEPVETSSRAVVSAWSVVLLVGFLVALALLAWLLVVVVKRTRRRSRAKVDAKVAAAVEEALLQETAQR